MPSSAKVLFKLEQDEDGYPPVSSETVWAKITDKEDVFILDNIPFFTSQSTLGDLVKTTHKNGFNEFDNVIAKSENSLIRVVTYDKGSVSDVREALQSFGCSTEWNKVHNIVAVNVPCSASLENVRSWLISASEKDELDYEEPILRQS